MRDLEAFSNRVGRGGSSQGLQEDLLLLSGLFSSDQRGARGKHSVSVILVHGGASGHAFMDV